jgi:hypothetical protein
MPLVGLGHIWATLVLHLEPRNDCLADTKGRTSSDTENGTLELANNFQLLREKGKDAET